VQIIDNKALLITTKKADQIVSLIPKSKLIDRQGEVGRVLVHWGFDETRLLRNLKIRNVPSPILRSYKWPGVYTPFDHQKTTAAFLAGHARCFCLSEAGTGKTSAAAWAADYLMNVRQIKRVLVVCPVSIMDTAWKADLFRTVMHRTVGIASGTREARRRIIEGDYEFVIINFDGVKVMTADLEKAAFDLIIVDECNAVQNVSTDRWKSLAQLIKPTTRLWMMTGTPAAQSPVQAYGLAKLVNPSSVPRFFGAFRDQVMYKISNFKWAPKVDAAETVHKILQPAIRFTKEECLDLPDLLYTTREVPLTKQQTHYYETIRKNLIAQAAGAEITAVNAATLLGKLLQVSAGCAYTPNREVIEFDIANRLNELMDVIEGTSQKIIVFVPFRHVLERLERDLTAKGLSVVGIHGGVAGSTRADYIRRFQTEQDPGVILLQPQAAAHGITLTQADTVVWWGPVPSAELYMQGNARAHRAGQKHPVTVVRLQGSSVERRIYGLLDGKLDLHQGLVDLFHQEVLA
jgi:SNF2 family DNA or RNA helicase